MIEANVEDQITKWEVDETRQQVQYTTTEGRTFRISFEEMHRQLKWGRHSVTTQYLQ